MKQAANTTAGATVALVLHAHDNVATALRPLEAGQTVQLQGVAAIDDTVQVQQAIGMCHKFALCDIAQGDMVRKHGEVIGRATQAIRIGAHVHVHNLRSNRAT
ncbi:MAG: UxaA family hydrolase [Betaproteobacteria bacterium]